MYAWLNSKQRGIRRGPKAFFRWAAKNTDARELQVSAYLPDTTIWIMTAGWKVHTHTPHKARKLKIPNEVCCEVKRDTRWKRVQTDHLIHSVNTEDFKELHIFFGATNSKAILWLAQTWPQPKRKGKRKRKDRGGGRAPQSQTEKWS